jgi:hypothetical protein
VRIALLLCLIEPPATHWFEGVLVDRLSTGSSFLEQGESFHDRNDVRDALHAIDYVPIRNHCNVGHHDCATFITPLNSPKKTGILCAPDRSCRLIYRCFALRPNVRALCMLRLIHLRRPISPFTLLHRLLIFALVVSANTAHAEQAFFMGLGDLPGGEFWSTPADISGDGSVVVGLSKSSSYSIGNDEVFRWTHDTGIVGLGLPTGLGLRISTDGSTIVGDLHNSGSLPEYQPYRWTQSNGVVSLSVPSSYGANGLFVNGDGSVIAEGQTYYLWLQSDGWQPHLNPDIPNRDMSDDGSVMVGWGGEIWASATGLNYLPNSVGGAHWYYGSFGSYDTTISGDGKVVVGRGFVGDDFSIASNRRVLRWTEDTGTVELPAAPDGAVPTSVNGSISADGSIILCRAAGYNSLYIWDAVHGTRNLDQLLINEYGLGGNLTGWVLNSTESPSYIGVSADGRTIYGAGTNPQGNREAWIAFLGTPTGIEGDFNHDGTVDSADYVVWRKGLGTTYDQNDYEAWRSHFGQTAGSGSGAAANAAVPEPASIVLLIMGTLTMCVRRHRALAT